MFYCASAMLLQLGARPKSHAGTISEFGRRCVMAGIASIEERDELILAERRRNAADYGTPQAEIDAHIAERLLETAGRWVERTPRQITEYARQSEPGGGKERSNGPDVER
ncbi:glr1425 [Gloeobacter violaceus PCC 7421]|uniref:Glr1425 protein n=2 Tax=Gloeobacter violaceus TaxID=33072 RepID=Q7NKQ2_GLOVI|nr:glr1425 [Gloeobacter violaceus PCC 7421]